MWTGHWGPSFVLKSITPEVPLGLLFLAASLPDLMMFLFVLLGVETLDLANYLPGTFRYVGNVPFTHSLLGTAILAFTMGLGYYFSTKSRVGATSLFLATISHFPLEIPGHRKDLRIFPNDSPSLGYGLFDSYLFTFLFEGFVIGYAFLYYISKTSPVASAWEKSESLTKALGLLLAFEHMAFTLFLVPTEHVKSVHIPMFLGQILMTSALAHAVDSMRVDNYAFWRRAEHIKRNIQLSEYTPTTGMAAK